MKRAFLLLVFILVLALITSFYQKTELVHQHDHAPQHQSEASQKQQQAPHPNDNHDGHDHQHGSHKTDDPQATSYVPLDPEIREALKQQLLLEGAMETQTLPDGRVVLPSNGRTTQMPVAIQHPDGTIEIREYSVVPKEEKQ
ncbi:hypothetical protein HF888_05205 [Bermanella marisrubri]|uniref:Uncharacterized protein n=1 Tax=Bermanella marisrubri TaxID=207949 RepID=Q1N1U9_9GAMM|nr:hypothetical protein [Bermanella marisrubri]EAT12182.1 hypothetical protein RED65_04130 [Oceanobacter sp. RED65] [Bermanella marisrubri]QIZ83656.1 hypothetical protein HF888_05205 [Bermanella marisrubri]